jgi:nicotinamide-nucleotide amidase
VAPLLPTNPARQTQPAAQLVALAEQVHGLLRERGATVATAESLTGGQLAAALTAVPGASATYLGGVVSYATAVKQSVLGVPQAVVDGPGVISPECALAMARGVVALTGADFALSTTGVAGPDLQEGHPPGTVHVGVVAPGGATALSLELVGDRAGITGRTCQEALAALADILQREDWRLG